jgi:hypothetical protein
MGMLALWRRASLMMLLGAAVWAPVLLSSPAEAARRAFVVGNASYQHVASLANPANDARDMASRLRELGWEVTLQFDASRAALLKGFQNFTRELTQDDTALVYYAGHALQIGGENYLAPTEANARTEDEVRAQFVPLNALLADLSRTTRTRIVILDACRDNPFGEKLAASQGTRSAGGAKGLARVYAGVGSFIVYSTQPGNVALDGSGRNSPFTKALLDHISLAGADVHAVMRRVRADVQQTTREQQIPWENSSLIDEVTFGSNVVASARRLEPQAPSAGTQPPPQTRGAPPAREPGPAPERPRQISFHYVTGLDPNGDNFLALRSGPKPGDVRIATMGPDTLLQVRESSGPWRRVELLDGSKGWAHSKWIACCRSIDARLVSAAIQAAPRPAPPPPSAAQSCDGIWYQRNAIWNRHGYCFTTTRGRAAFDTSSCFRDQGAARAAMSAEERKTVDALLARERTMGCR